MGQGRRRSSSARELRGVRPFERIIATAPLEGLGELPPRSPAAKGECLEGSRWGSPRRARFIRAGEAFCCTKNLPSAGWPGCSSNGGTWMGKKFSGSRGSPAEALLSTRGESASSVAATRRPTLIVRVQRGIERHAPGGPEELRLLARAYPSPTSSREESAHLGNSKDTIYSAPMAPPGESARSWPKSSISRRPRRDGRAVDLDEGSLARTLAHGWRARAPSFLPRAGYQRG